MIETCGSVSHSMKFPRVLILTVLCGSCFAADNAAPKPPAKPAPKVIAAYDDPASTDADFPFTGEFVGKFRDADFAFQVLVLGAGKFDAVLCPGGLPGAGWTRQPALRQHVSGKRESDAPDAGVRFSSNGWMGLLKGDVIELRDFKGGSAGRLQRVERKSETLGAKPPEGAVVLFDGTSVAAFQDGAKMTKDGLLMQGCTTKDAFGDCLLHIEFRVPYMPEASGQARGNSGVYLASRYEVQVLDSFGLKGENNECGGIYTVAKPEVNMCLPPLTWQTYDIEFKAPLFDDKGVKTADAQLTVRHNGVLIHDKVTVPKPTTSAPVSTDGKLGTLYLQDHGCPVGYRNIWLVKK